MRSGLAWLVAVPAALLLLSPPATAGATQVHLSAREFAFVPKEVTVPPGEVVFAVKNDGAVEHNFLLADSRTKRTLAEIAILEPGESAEVKATLQAASYAMYCSLPGHREAGMEGLLHVK